MTCNRYNQLSLFKDVDFGFYSTLPFCDRIIAERYADELLDTWKEVDVKPKGNGWVIIYRNRQKGVEK